MDRPVLNTLNAMLHEGKISASCYVELHRQVSGLYDEQERLKEAAAKAADVSSKRERKGATKTILFELTMPNVNTWNGHWSGEGKRYYSRRTVKAAQDPENKLDSGYFYYNFGDGWGAGVITKRVTAAEANRAMKKSAGFQGYDWMIDEILTYGKILTRKERHEL